MTRKKVVAGAPNRDAAELLGRWGIDIDPEMLVLALTHRSFAYEAGGLPTNERLEFLGDSVLSIVVTERLYKDYPTHPESHLAKMRAATVSQDALAIVARNIGLGDFILLGRGESMSGGRQKDSILSDTVEALIGATYLCHGLEPTRRVVEHLLADLLRHALERGQTVDWKTNLQEYCSAHGLADPAYDVVGEGPDHDRTFRATVTIGGKAVGHGVDSSKKHAENHAARDALLALEGPAADPDA